MLGISTSKTFTKKIHAQQWAKSVEVTIESGQYKAKLNLTVKCAFYRTWKISYLTIKALIHTIETL